MGVTVCDPETMDLPACATDLGNGTWVRHCYIGNNITSVFNLIPFSCYIFKKIPLADDVWELYSERRPLSCGGLWPKLG